MCYCNEKTCELRKNPEQVQCTLKECIEDLKKRHPNNDSPTVNYIKGFGGMESNLKYINII